MNDFFLEILNTGIMAGWLVLAVLLARLLLKKAPAWAKCALWAVVALRLVWPFEIESILSLVPSAQTLPPAALTAPAPEIHTGIPYLNTAINPTFTQTFQPAPAATVSPLQTAVSVAAIVWVVGMIAMAVYASVSYLRLRRRVRVSMPAADGVYLCDAISSPFILGLIRPKIYLPSDLPQEKWDAILAHERAHLARRDHWWKPLGFALLTAFWFHPLLWLGYICLCRDVELACDEKVVKTLSDEEKREYSETLLQCSVPKKWITACPLAFGETGVKQRIKVVLHYKKPTLWIIIAALLIGSVLAVCFLTEPQTDLTDSVYHIEQQVYRPMMMSYNPCLSGYFRVTEENILQYGHTQSDDIMVREWMDFGQLKKTILTEDFDECPFGDDEGVFGQIRRNNKNAWQVVGADEHPLWDGYFLEQQNGDFYYLMNGCFLYQLSRRPASEAPVNISNKQYVYEKPGAGSEFYINIYSDGTFQYYAGNYSSHIGLGDWELKDGKLYLYDTTLQNPMTFVFSVEQDALAYIAAESHPFMYVNVADGDLFKFYGEVKPPEQDQTPEEPASGQAVGFYSENGDDFSWNFGISVFANGQFSYSKGLASSYIGHGTWRQENGKLYLTGGDYCYVFRVEQDGLVFIEKESDRGMSLKDGDLIPRVPMEKYLTFVQVTEIQDDHFLALDVKGNTWHIEHPCKALDFDLEKCWVSYYGQPQTDDEGRYLVRAAECWLYREHTDETDVIYDSYLFDVDGDGTAEHCYLTSKRGASYVSVSNLDLIKYKLTVEEPDGTTYEAEFLELLILDENAFGSIPSPDTDTSQLAPVHAYAEVFAFAVENGELLILAPRGGEYIETGTFTTYQITLADNKLIVKQR